MVRSRAGRSSRLRSVTRTTSVSRRRLSRAVNGLRASWIVATSGCGASKSSRARSRKASDASSIFPISSITTIPPSGTCSRAGSANRSKASTSTPYFPTRGGPGRSTCASVARAPSKVSTVKPTRRPRSRISSVVNPASGIPSRRSNSAIRTATVVFPIPGLPPSKTFTVGLLEAGGLDRPRDARIDGRNGALLSHPRVAAEVLREDPLRGPRRQRLRGQRRVDAADAVRERRRVGDEQAPDSPRLAVRVDDRVRSARAHPHRGVQVEEDGRDVHAHHALGARGPQQLDRLPRQEVAVVLRPHGSLSVRDFDAGYGTVRVGD